MDEEKLRLLREYGHYLSVPEGASMWPLFKNTQSIVDIVPYDRVLKKYDVALYWNESLRKCVLHRVISARQGQYVFCGDNCRRKENVPEDSVMGVAARFKRTPDSPWVSMNDWRCRLYAHIWCDFLPLRRLLCRARDAGKRFLHRLRLGRR